MPLKSALTPSQVEKYKKILKSNGITDEVSDVIVVDAGLEGEGFTSKTLWVTVTFQNASLKPMHLFVKTEIGNESHSKYLEETKYVKKETEFFMKYIPFARELCRSKGYENFLDIYPRCYYGDEKMLVFENLVVGKGYEMLDKVKQQDFEAASLAMTTIAKHHAISHACIREAGGAEEFFKRFPYLDFEPFVVDASRPLLESQVENAVSTNIEILKKSKAKGKEEVIEFLKAKSGTVWNAIEKLLERDADDTLLVLNHGDYWNNNMMFLRDKSSNKLVKHVAVDFQISRYASPILDLSSYIYSSVKPDIRGNHIQDLLKTYLEALNSTSAKLGHPTSLSYEELFEMYRKKLDYGFWYIGMLVTCSASFVVVKDIDITKVDMKDFSNVRTTLVLDWMENNPEICEKDAEKIVKLVMEFKSIKQQKVK